MMSSSGPVIAISMGDPNGIGPEVLVKTLSDREVRRSARFHVYGCNEAMLRAAEQAGIEPYWWRASPEAASVGEVGAHHVVVMEEEGACDGCARGRHEATAAGGSASMRFVERAIEAAHRAEGDPLRAGAITTAPISKAAWALAGHKRWPGHTELLAERFRAKRHRMMFVCDELRVVLATTHLPLMQVRDVLTVGAVHDSIDLAAEACARFGAPRARVAVCGLNPHAGEGGLFGDEEERLITPAIKLAHRNGIDVHGPFPGDTIFNAARAGRYDVVVAMYHDQGTIPVKLLAFDRAVNVTIGLPVIRTSPDHGTAYDIAGRGAANESSMMAAVRLAIAHASRDQPVRSSA
ncbi:MAG: 4-hydroxythreonine-4-phosphate dehydrogenase PdxA [Planctomycetota bacterium]